MTSRAVLSAGLLVLSLAASTAGSGLSARSLIFDFLNDMEGWASYRGSWHWSDRASLENTLPANSIDDGFAIMNEQHNSDELYTPYVSVPSGGSVTITFFLRSRWEGSNSMYVDLMQRNKPAERLIDLTGYSSQFSSNWFVVTADIPPAEDDVMMVIFCYNGEAAPAGSLLYGCALDQIKIDIHGDNTTTVPTTAAPTNAPETTAAPTDAPETTAAPTDAPETTAAPTDAPETTAAPTDAPETTAAPTDAPETTAAPTDAPETTAAPTDAPETTAAPTDAPETTAAPTDAPETTAAPTDAPETTAAPTDAPDTTAAPTDAPETTAAPTDAPETTAAPTDAPETTEPPTDAPETTEAPTDAPETTEAPTDAPETTEAPTDAPETTEAPTDAPETTEAPTDAPETTEAPTDAPETTEAPTDAPETTEAPTDAPETTEAPTDAPETTEAPTDAPETTEAPTDAPETTEAPTDAPETTEAPTDAPETTAAPTDAPTDAPESTAAPTNAPETTAAPTDAPETTAAPTDAITPTTTEGPSGPLEYDFQSSTQGWTLSHMNGAAWKRVQFNNTGLPVSSPPEGPWVLQVFSSEVFAGTTLAQSPKLEATGTTLTVDITFWMDGDRDLPAQLKARRRGGFNTYDVEPVMNLDPYGDQTNYHWVVYRASLYNMVPGETFTITLEGSLGSHPNNSVVVNKVVLDGVKEIPTDPNSIIDFEDGLFGWSVGNMDGGRWVLQRWSEVDPSLNVPQPSDGENFLLVERFDIHSGVISLESPAFPIQAGQRKKVHVKFWLRGSVVYPAALRFRKKTMNGEYDDLPFLNLAPYGDINHPNWMLLDREYYIPVDETEEAFQLVIEADPGSDEDNMVALDDLQIITEYISQ